MYWIEHRSVMLTVNNKTSSCENVPQWMTLMSIYLWTVRCGFTLFLYFSRNRRQLRPLFLDWPERNCLRLLRWSRYLGTQFLWFCTMNHYQHQLWHIFRYCASNCWPDTEYFHRKRVFSKSKLISGILFALFRT